MDNPFEKKKESYPADRIICDKTFDLGQIDVYIEFGILKDMLFKNCVIRVGSANLMRIQNCWFQDCVLEEITIYKVDVHDSVFSNCRFFGGSFSKSDILNSFLVQCRFSDIIMIDIWCVESFLKDVTFNSETQEWFRPNSILDMIDCKIWRSDQWVSVPGSRDVREFFNL